MMSQITTSWFDFMHDERRMPCCQAACGQTQEWCQVAKPNKLGADVSLTLLYVIFQDTTRRLGTPAKLQAGQPVWSPMGVGRQAAWPSRGWAHSDGLNG